MSSVCVTSWHEPAGELLRHWLGRLGFQSDPEGFPIGLLRADHGPEGFALRVSALGAFIEAGDQAGAMYGALAFFEQALDCHFLAADCALLPEQAVIKPVHLVSAPAFAHRELYWRGALAPDFAVQLRLNASRGGLPAGSAWGLKFYNYSHSFDALVDPQEYFDSHPEYFSLVDGKRQKDFSQLCLSNPQVLAIVTDKVLSWMREHPDCQIFSVSMNDWYAPCECPDCAAIDDREGSQSGSLLHFVNQVADAVRPEFPDNYIHTFAYLYGRKPPRQLKARDNVIIRLCPIERCFSHALDSCDAEVGRIDVATASARSFSAGGDFAEHLQGWAAACQHLYIWDYTCNYANYLQPFPNLPALQQTLRWYRDQGVEGLFLQGNYSPGQTSAFAALKVYCMARLLWDPDADLQAMRERFVRGYYGQAAADKVLACLALADGAVQPHHMSLYDGPDAPYLQGSWLRLAQDLLQQALAATVDPDHRQRLELELLSTRYVLLTQSPLDSPDRDAAVDAFAADCRRLGISELFERRQLEASFDCMKHSRFARDRDQVPYSFYRLQ